MTNLTYITTIKYLLQKNNLRPNKVMGQHFLVSKNVLQKIIAAAELKKTDTVLEVGPGLGALTQALAEHAGRIIAVEKDQTLIPVLREVLQGASLSLFLYNNKDKDAPCKVEIIRDDILKFNPKVWNLEPGNYKIVADIPYYLTSHFLRQFLETPHQPSHMVLLVQKELAQRICAKPPHGSLLSNAVRYYAIPKIVSLVPKSAFFPPPKIDSAILKLEIIRKHDPKLDKIFFKLLKIGFSTPRKQIFHILSKKIPGIFSIEKRKQESFLVNCLNEANISKKQRPQEIELGQWIELAKLVTE